MKSHNAGCPVSLTLGGLQLQGFAISALASYVMVPSLGACFDLGHCPIEAVGLDTIFLSHVHKDHVAGLPLYLSLRTMQEMKPAKVYCPESSRDALLKMLDAFDRMEGPVVYDRSKEIIGVRPGDTFRHGKNTIRVFGVHHRIDSVGYTVVENRSKLRPEYVGKSGEEIRLAKLRGEPVTDTLQKDIFTYVGDSTSKTLEDHPELAASEVLMVEATYLPGTPVEKASVYGHTHLEELVSLRARCPELLSNPHLVLKHFSMRYDREMVMSALKALPEEFQQNTTALI